MKKTIAVIMLMLSLTILFTSCENQTVTSSQNLASEEGQTETVFSFAANGIPIPMNAKADDVIPKLGAHIKYFEAPSCAFQGLDKTYTYAGYELYTYEVNGIDHILSVVLLDDSVMTPEKITIGSTLEDVKKAYGEDFVQDGSSYTYTKGKSQLVFILENAAVTSIEYKTITG